MQIPILNGIYSDEAPDFRTSYPKNLIPVPKVNGISDGYLRPADGLVELAEGTAVDRGGINWDGTLYRVLGSKLVSISSAGVIAEIGEVGGTTELVTMKYSFDRLAVASNNNLFYYNTSIGFIQVTDPDLGDVVDLEWVDGYFMTTDSEYIVITELADPTSVDPLKYGSSEAAPDPIVALLKLRNEIYALNRYSIEVFDNVGGTGFPFQRIDGAQIDRGVLGTHACCVFMETIAFMGGGRDEAPAIWLGNNATAIKISSREIDQILAEYTEEELAICKLETRIDKSHNFLLIHFQDQTLVYDANASQIMQTQVWHSLSSVLLGTESIGDSRYRAKNLVWVYDKWVFGDPTSFKIGYYTDTISTHFGDDIDWEFGTTVIYNEGNGAIIHELELVCLSGRVALGADPTIWAQYSLDGSTWSNPRPISAGKQGERNKRLVWLQQGTMRNWRIQKFRGTSDGHTAVIRLEAKIEPLYA